MNNNIYVTITLFRGWLVTYSAAALGLVLGILYVWSVIKAGIPDSWGWSNADKALPYALMAIVFSVMMVPAGRMQDRFGPRPMVFLSGFLIGLGCLVSGLSGSSLLAYLLGFGFISGTGVSFGYSAITPAAVKWFPNERTGLITGIVVSGVGLAPVLMAPLTAWLLRLFSFSGLSGIVENGVSATMITIGITLWLVTAMVGWFIVNPPLGFSPLSQGEIKKSKPHQDMTWNQMLKTSQFWFLFAIFYIGSSAGLVFIGVAADLGKQALGELAFLAVVVLSIGNATGRVLAGIISDKIGRHWTLIIDNLFQSAVIFYLYQITSSGGELGPYILLVVFLIGMNYGAIHSIFPATCKDYFGIRNFGHNYGCLFLAFGAAGFIMPWVNGWIQDSTGKPDYSYLLIIGLLLLATILAVIGLKLGPPGQPHKKD